MSNYFDHLFLYLLGHIAVLRTSMRPSVTNRVAWSVGWSVTLVIPAETAALIEMPFGLRTPVGPGNHVLDGGPDPPREGEILRGKGATHCKVYGHSAVICAKTAKPIKMPFGLWARMDRRNRVLDGDPEVLMDIAVATNFGTKIAIDWLCVNDSD